MKRVLFLSVLMVVAGASSASAQDGDIARELNNISWDLFQLHLDIAYPLPGIGYSGGGYFPVYQQYYQPTKGQIRQWKKNYYRAQYIAKLKAERAAKIVVPAPIPKAVPKRVVVAHKGPRF